MNTFIIIAIIIVSVALIGIVLIQNAKGGGLASNVGVSSQMFGGVKKQSDLVEKITWGLIIALFILCLGSGFSFNAGSEGSDQAPRVQVPAQSAPATPPATSPLPTQATPVAPQK
ncbi:MAG: preprotein translocase subunit SecG [Flavobacteriales bacterium]